MTDTEFHAAIGLITVRLSMLESHLDARDTSRDPMEDYKEPILRHFGFSHLKGDLQNVSRPFGELAAEIVQHLPRCAERTAALRKLLEAKDSAVRAWLEEQD